MTSFTSILFPDSEAATEPPAAPDCLSDLHLDQVIDAVTSAEPGDGLKGFFYAPLHDVAGVTYRHEVFRDLERDELRRPIDDFVAAMRTVRQRYHQAKTLFHPLQRQGWLVYAVQAYCAAVSTLSDAFTRVEKTSRGLRDFADHVRRYADGATFRKLQVDAQTVQGDLHRVRYAVHIQGLRVHVEKFTGQTDYSLAVAETFARFATDAAKDYHVRIPDAAEMDHVEEQILDRVAKLYPRPFAQLAGFCTRHQHFVDPVISRFDREIRFYLSYLTFIAPFTAAGLRFSYPEVTVEPGVVRADGAFDLSLALKSVGDGAPVVCNDFRLSGPERIFVVTGPNQGGKTTVARTIGQCVYLAALGCPVPATRSACTVPDAVYTHFERQETLATLHGKLDDELVRIHQILSRATATSVVVMNESFASTTVDDAVLIGTSVLKQMIALGCVAVYVTFLDELASLDPACVSMVGEVAHHDPTQRTFRFTRRPPDGLAYAAALAAKYGVTHDALRERVDR